MWQGFKLINTLAYLRPDIRIRIRGVVIRIRVRQPVVRGIVTVAAEQDT